MGQSRPAQHRQAHEGAVTAVVPTPDGLYLLTAGTDSRIRLWDLQDNRYACPPMVMRQLLQDSGPKYSLH